MFIPTAYLYNLMTCVYWKCMPVTHLVHHKTGDINILVCVSRKLLKQPVFTFGKVITVDISGGTSEIINLGPEFGFVLFSYYEYHL